MEQGGGGAQSALGFVDQQQSRGQSGQRGIGCRFVVAGGEAFAVADGVEEGTRLRGVAADALQAAVIVAACGLL
ncbi:hypothetical protein ASD72_19675 [Pseudoxanthomonas sp. Root630]|nr:hypothetical protein ASD72_19675 [Pseudoxanthomonas sp. Root630]